MRYRLNGVERTRRQSPLLALYKEFQELDPRVIRKLARRCLGRPAFDREDADEIRRYLRAWIADWRERETRGL